MNSFDNHSFAAFQFIKPSFLKRWLLFYCNLLIFWVEVLLMENRKDFQLSKYIFYILIALFVSLPILHVSKLSHVYLDAAVQIKSGLWMIENKSFLPGDVFSWHEGLNWVQHEIGWYFLSGLAYKLLGMYGIFILDSLSCIIVSLLFFKYNKNNGFITTLFSFATLIAVSSDALFVSRPFVISTPIILYLLLAMYENKEPLHLCIIFMVSSFIIAWFHGGFVPILFVMFAVYIAISFIKKEYKVCKACLSFIPATFLVTLLQPMGIKIWTYYFKQGKDSGMSTISEWQPGNLDAFYALLLAVLVVCATLSPKLRRLDKSALLQTAFICMFGIMFFIHTRFLVLFFMVLGFSAPALLDNAIHFITKKFPIINKFNPKSLTINKNNIASKLLCFSYVPVALLIAIEGYQSFTSFSKDLNEMASRQGYSESIIQAIKDNNVQHLMNGYNEGSWLIFNDIKVSNDNRNDLYLEAFSGKDYAPDSMSINAVKKYIRDFDVDYVLLNGELTYEQYKDPMFQSNFDYYEEATGDIELVYTEFVPINEELEEQEITDETMGIQWFLYKVSEEVVNERK